MFTVVTATVTVTTAEASCSFEFEVLTIVIEVDFIYFHPSKASFWTAIGIEIVIEKWVTTLFGNRSYLGFNFTE
jgi:hypothetical protein